MGKGEGRTKRRTPFSNTASLSEAHLTVPDDEDDACRERGEGEMELKEGTTHLEAGGLLVEGLAEHVTGLAHHSCESPERVRLEILWEAEQRESKTRARCRRRRRVRARSVGLLGREEGTVWGGGVGMGEGGGMHVLLCRSSAVDQHG